ncbi:MAG: 50S ribosomal protein L4 [Clostridia bacterium]
MKTNVYNIDGKQVGSLELSAYVFEQEYNEALIHQVVVAQLANKRQGTKCTLTRSEVRGGGAKPWKQKGTGRARQGSIRSPQWIKGGVVFAPKPRDFSQKINKKMKDGALLSALSQKVRDEQFMVIDAIAMAPKTKVAQTILNNLKVNSKALLVIAGEDENILRATNNIQNLTVITADLLNVYDLIANAKCIITKDAVTKLEEVYA